VQSNRAGPIAMKLDEGDSIIGVSTCTAENDVLLTTALGRCIRFSVGDVRVFAGRSSDGVRGIRLADADEVISMAILRSVAATPAERTAYLRYAASQRAALGDADAAEGLEPEVVEEIEAEEGAELEGEVPMERLIELGAAEEQILTISSEGFGKRTSAYDYRRTGRGGQGLIAQDLTRRGGRLAASFPVEEGDEILLVSDQGQLIRVRVAQIRIAGRNTQGVTIFRKAEDEHVVSVERLAEAGGDEDVDDAAEDDGGEGEEGGEA
jgi:DNA gyrase subunit A